jgi:hypothetical protein
MRRPSCADPPRWREAHASGLSMSARRLASTVDALPIPEELDDVRLAQIRQRVLQEAPPSRASVSTGWAWRRTVTLSLAFLLLGGITTAMAARVYIRRLQRVTAPAQPALPATSEVMPRTKVRRFRMAVREPAELEVSLGPDGAEIAVTDGRAEISGPRLANPVLLTPGRSWSAGDAGADSSGLRTRAPRREPERREVPSVDHPIQVALAASEKPRVEPTVSALSRPRGTIPATPSSLSRAAAAGLDRPDGPALEPPPLGALPSTLLAPPRPVAKTASPPDLGALRLVPRATSEAFLLGSALRALRSEHAPLRALAKLDEHRSRFSGGALQREAALARVEALLTLGRQDDALAVLDALALEAGGADRKVHLARAELRASHGRCADAIGDLDHVLATPADDTLAARAYYARARCALHVHDPVRAGADLREYLTRFPGGPRRSEVETLLRRLGG